MLRRHAPANGGDGVTTVVEDGADGSAVEFDPFSDSFFDDPYEIYRWLRDQAPVYYSQRWDFYAISRHDDVITAHRDWETYSSAYGVTLDDIAKRQKLGITALIVTDPPEHSRLRRLVRQAFTRKAVADLEPLVVSVIDSFVEGLLERETFDIVADFAAQFPVEVIAAMLGVPEGERQQIRLWTDAILHREANELNPTEDGMAASMELYSYVLDFARDKRRSPDDLIMSQLVTAEFEDEDGATQRLTDDDLAAFGLLLLAAGSETVTKLIGSGVVAFHHNRDQWQMVLDDVGRIPGAVEEMLRLNPPSQYQGRLTTRDVVVAGTTIPEGSPTLLITGAATRDPRAFDNPDVFDISRGGTTTLAFGYGAHSCLGSWLARLEARVAFQRLRRHWPSFEVDTNGLRRVTMSNVAGFSNVPVLAKR
jgi:cytochrome P450